MIMQKESKWDKWDRRSRYLPAVLLSCAGFLFWVVVLSYAVTTGVAINGVYAIVAGALLTIGVVATLPKQEG